MSRIYQIFRIWRIRFPRPSAVALHLLIDTLTDFEIFLQESFFVLLQVLVLIVWWGAHSAILRAPAQTSSC